MNNNILDKIGFSASFICAIHCAFLPFIITALSLSQLQFLIDPSVEVGVVLLSFIIGVLSLVPAYLKHHNKLQPILIILIGFFTIILGHTYFEIYEKIITPIGAMFVATSHIWNWKILANHFKKTCQSDCHIHHEEV